MLAKHRAHLLDTVHRLAVDGQQHVARLHAGPLRRAAHALDQQAVVQPGLRQLGAGQRPHREAERGTFGRRRDRQAVLVGRTERHAHLARGLVAPHVEQQLVARLGQADAAGQVARHTHRLLVDAGDHVTGLQARLLGRAAGRHAGDQRAVGPLEAERRRQRCRQVLQRHAQPRVVDAALGDDLRLRVQRHVERDRERQALEAAALRVDLRVDAHHAAAGVEQRAAAVAGVHRGVGLDEGHHAVARQ